MFDFYYLNIVDCPVFEYVNTVLKLNCHNSRDSS